MPVTNGGLQLNIVNSLVHIRRIAVDEKNFVCECGKVCKNLAGLKAHQRACKWEAPLSVYEVYMARALAEVESEITQDEIEAVRQMQVEAKDFKFYASAWKNERKKFPFSSKQHLLSELVQQPGVYRDLYMEAEELGRILFSEKSPLDDALNKPHDMMAWNTAHRELLGRKDKPSGKLIDLLDKAWAGVQDEQSSRMAEVFKGRPDMLKAVLENQALYDNATTAS